MPFGRLDWAKGQPVPDFDGPPPEPLLRRNDDRSFFLVESFCYLVPVDDPAAGTIFAVPGTDTPAAWRAGGRTTWSGQQLVVPPSVDSKTDLASVPWYLWWLVASYGNHTRAVLLHDALYVDSPSSPVSRTEADRLLLRALRERGAPKAGAFRHWLMWAAVSLFGTKLRFLFLGPPFLLYVLAFWLALSLGVAWAWGDVVWDPPWTWRTLAVGVGATLLAVGVLALTLGLAWRTGIDRRLGWLLALIPLAGVLGTGLVLEWPNSFELEPWASPFNLFAVATLLLWPGYLWGFVVDRTLRGWLWPTAVIGFPPSAIPVGLIFLSTWIVWIVDLGAVLAATARGRPFKWPDMTPWRYPV